jgi:hypothetical protein
MAERQLAPERFARKLQLADNGGEGDDVEEVGSGAVEEVLSYCSRFSYPCWLSGFSVEEGTSYVPTLLIPSAPITTSP